MTSSVELWNGQKMPIVGLGTSTPKDKDETEQALEEALKAGYRHIDASFMHRCESLIGGVLKRWIFSGKVKREDLFITTKLPMNGMRPEHVEHFLKKSLENLKLDYVDMYMIHFPIGFEYVSDTETIPRDKDGKALMDKTTNLEAIWAEMEKQVDAGRTKSIGFCNFGVSQIERIVKVARVRPANIQIEIHAYYQQEDVQEVCKKHNIAVTAYGPLGRPYINEVGPLQDPFVNGIATKLKRTPAQVLLKFLVQQNIAVVPRSSKPERLQQNFQLDFQLSPADMAVLKKLSKFDAPSNKEWTMLSDHPECPYKK